MSLSSNVCLGALRLQAQERSDLVGSPNISVPNWNRLITNSAKELMDILVSAYGNEYFVQTPYQFMISGQELYNLPPDMYKLLGVDMQYSGSPTGWVTLKRFEFIERNKYSWLNPLPIQANLVQLWYVPEPTPLQFTVVGASTAGSPVIQLNAQADLSDLSVGMSASCYGITPTNPLWGYPTITAIDSGLNQITLSTPVLASIPINIIYCWRDDAVFDGIAGWEEYVIIDAARKAGIPQETDISALMFDKAAITKRVEDMAEGRDLGQAHHVGDAMSVNTPIVSLGATNLKYRIMGKQIMFVPCGYDDFGGKLWRHVRILMQLPIIKTGQPQFDTQQGRWKSILDPLLAKPLSDLLILPNVVLTAGANVINHRLGRIPQGWVVLDIDAASLIYRSAPFNKLTLNLICSAPATISLGVF